MKVKFQTEQGVAIMRGNQQVAQQCLVTIVQWKDEHAEHRKNRREGSIIAIIEAPRGIRGRLCRGTD